MTHIVTRKILATGNQKLTRNLSMEPLAPLALVLHTTVYHRLMSLHLQSFTKTSYQPHTVPGLSASGALALPPGSAQMPSDRDARAVSRETNAAHMLPLHSRSRHIALSAQLRRSRAPP